MKKLLWFTAVVIGFLALPSLVAADSSYGSGAYGSCQYSSCSISISSTSTVNLNITPTTAGRCTVNSDAVSVLTDNTNGYTLTLANSSTNTSLVNGANTVTQSSGSIASPTTLTANKWGFRVDSLGSFGSGPTTSQTNIAIPSTTFAGVPASNATAATIANTAVPADPAVTTTVWYGACIDTSVPSGTYTTNVTYTATAN